MASAAQTRASDIPRAQQLPALSLSLCLEHCALRSARALRNAHVEGGLSVSRVSRIIAGVGAVVLPEEAQGKT